MLSSNWKKNHSFCQKTTPFFAICSNWIKRHETIVLYHDLLENGDIWRLNIRFRQPFYPINFSTYRTTNSIHLLFLFVLLTIKPNKSRWVSIPDTFQPTENGKGRIGTENANDFNTQWTARKGIAFVTKYWKAFLLSVPYEFPIPICPLEIFCTQMKNKVPICSANYQVPCMTFWWNSNDCRHFKRRSVNERFISFNFWESTEGGVWHFSWYSGWCSTSITTILSIFIVNKFDYFTFSYLKNMLSSFYNIWHYIYI